MVALASSFGTQLLSLPDTPPVVVAASFETTTGDWVVVFDKDLVSGVTDVSNWILRAVNFRWTPQIPILIDGNVIRGGSVQSVLLPGDSEISYSASIPDLVGVNGLSVEPFTFEPSVDIPVPVFADYSVSNAWITVGFSEAIFINQATKQDFSAVVSPNTLNIQSLSAFGPDAVRLGISIDGPGSLPDLVEYSGVVDGIEDAGGNDVPFFQIMLNTVA